jgi:dienelactone hydrolase
MIKSKWIAVLAAALFFTSVFGQASSLPKPTGRNFVGVTYLSFTDDQRIELFDNSQKSKREITVKAWYPADETSKPEPYLRNIDFAVKYLILPEAMRSLETNSALDIAISTNEEKYPVLVFSHGWGEQNSQNTILMEELASRGFIVFSVAHHYECKYSEYPDGKISYIDFSSLRFQKIMGEQQSPKAMELLVKLYGATTNEERMQVFHETADAMPMLFASPKYWTADLSFFLDQIDDINKTHVILKGRIDTDRIGALGMSLGGVVTSELCLHDPRVKAGLSMDGGLYGSLLAGQLDVPFMFLSGRRFAGCGPLFSDKSVKDCYAFAIKNADHYNFTDYALFPFPMIQFMLGAIDGKRSVEIVNTMVPYFFEKYLKGNKEIDLLKAAAKFPEMEVSSNIIGEEPRK